MILTRGAGRPTTRIGRLSLACVPLAVALLLAMAGCSERPQRGAAPAQPSAAAQKPEELPTSRAGEIVERAIAAAGGRDAWRRHRDASFLGTVTFFDAGGNPSSESIYLYRVLLHQGVKVRLESVGLPDELVFGLNGPDWWMLRSGRPVDEGGRTVGTQFLAATMAYWFQLPFVLAEDGSQLSYEGPEVDQEKRWEKVRVQYGNESSVPFEWLVFYFDAETGLIDRLHCAVRAAFLRQPLWVGKWREYRELGGIKRERRRAFYPADREGRMIGPVAAEQLIEHTRFDDDPPAEWFRKPLVTGPGSPT